MRLLDDERGQSVQVGAALLLGFVVIAITMYQVEVVPDQNAEVEFNHNQEVREDMTELRNAISNAGTTGGGESTTVKLGTQYPPRSIFVNPSPPRGELRSELAGNISLRNASVDGTYSGTGNPNSLLTSTHRTKRLTYVPHYTELNQAGNVSIEHSLAFAAFDNGATDPLTAQSVIQGKSLTLTMLRGNLSEQGSGPVSVDPRTVNRTDRITISPSGDDPIVLTIPTRTPEVWNETIGLTYTEGEQQAQVERWDSDAGEIEVSLNRSEYQLRMAAVGIGTGVQETDRYDVKREDGGSNGNGNGSGGAYSIDWTDPSQESVNSGADVTCSAEYCTWDVGASNDDLLTLNASLDQSFEGIDLEYAVTDSTVGSVAPGSGVTATDGANTTVLSADGNGSVQVLASANEGSDTIEIEVSNVSGDDSNGGNDPSAIQFNNFQGFSADAGANEFTLNQINVQDADNDDDLDRVEYVITDSSGNQVASRTVSNIGPGQYGEQSLTFSGTVQPGETYTIEAIVYDDDENYNSQSLTDSVTSAASQVSSNNDATTFWGGSSAVEFSVSNSGNSDVSITAITVNGTSESQVAQIEESQTGSHQQGQHEVYIDALTPGVLDMNGQPYTSDAGDPLPLGSRQPLTEDAVISAQSTATISLNAFVNNGGGSVNMDGATVTITLHFDDGSSDTYTLQP